MKFLGLLAALAITGCATKSDLPVREELKVIEVQIDGDYIEGCMYGIGSVLYNLGIPMEAYKAEAFCMESFLKKLDRKEAI